MCCGVYYTMSCMDFYYICKELIKSIKKLKVARGCAMQGSN